MSADAMPPGMALGAPGRLSAVEEALVRPGAPLLYRVTEVMGLLGLSRSVVFEQLRDGRLRSVHQGRARRIPATAVLDYVRLLEREAAERASD
jgi:excisionase family DNA binding protein